MFSGISGSHKQPHCGEIERENRIVEQIMADKALYREATASFDREGIQHYAIQGVAA
jgi:hypothetical protein